MTLRSGLALRGVPIERVLPAAVHALGAGAAAFLLSVLVYGGLLRGTARRPGHAFAALTLSALFAVPPATWASFNTPPGTGTFRRWIWEAYMHNET